MGNYDNGKKEELNYRGLSPEAEMELRLALPELERGLEELAEARGVRGETLRLRFNI